MMKKLPVIVGVALVGVALVGSAVLFVAPVAASPAKAGPVPTAAVRSTLGAGYLTSPSTGVAVAETEFRVPSITCAHNNDIEALWLGAAGYEGTGGTGIDDLYAQVAAICNNGVISYTAWAVAPGASESASVSPGDVIDTYFRDSASGSVAQVFKIQKPTSTEVAGVVGNAANEQSVLVGNQRETLVVPKFRDIPAATDTVHFLKSYVNGYLMRFDGYPTLQLNQAGAHLEIGTSSLSNNDTFHLTFRSHS